MQGLFVTFKLPEQLSRLYAAANEMRLRGFSIVGTLLSLLIICLLMVIYLRRTEIEGAKNLPSEIKSAVDRIHDDFEKHRPVAIAVLQDTFLEAKNSQETFSYATSGSFPHLQLLRTGADGSHTL